MRGVHSAGVLSALILLAGCGGGSSGGQPSVSDPTIVANPLAGVTVSVEGDLDALSVVGGSSSFGSGEARLSASPGRDVGNVTGQVELVNVDATRVALHSGYAGTTGDEVFTYSQVNDDRWMIPAGRALTTAQIDQLEAGGMYIRVDTAAHPDGALRAQLSGAAVDVVVAELSGAQQVPAVMSAGGGTVATTVDTTTGDFRVHVNTWGIDDAVASHIHQAFAGSNGGVLVGLAQDGSNSTHWWAEATLDAAGLTAYQAGELYLNLHTASNGAGELRGQVAPPGIDVQFTTLTGMQQNPAVSTSATGIAATTLNTASGDLVAHVNTTDIADDAFAAHIHTGFAGAGGGVVVGLTQDATDPGHFMVTDAVLDADGLALYDAGELYFNVHTNDHPGGELRGQIAPDSVAVVFSALSGSQQIPELQSAASGVAATTFHGASGRLTVHVHTQGVDDAVAAHVHRAFAGANGGVAVGLEADAARVGLWSADAMLDDSMQAAFSAGEFYVNVHTPANPGGELRAQIVPDDIELVFSRLDGDQSVPMVATDASGLAATTVNPATGAIVAHVHPDGVDDASAAHIHRGARGATGGVAVGLTQDGADLGHWTTPADATLDPTGVMEFLAGELYFNVHTPTNPAGEIRGQIDTGKLGLGDPIFALFVNAVEPNTIMTKCIFCHVEGGFAAGTPLVYQRATVDGHTEFNFRLIESYVRGELSELGNAQRYLDKPTATVSHAGGMQVDPTTDEFADLATFARGL